MVFGAGFITDGGSYSKQHVFIPGGTEANSLWIYSGQTSACTSMKAFIPPVVFRNAEPGNSWRLVHHLPDLFIQSHSAYEVFHSFFNGKPGIEKWVLVRIMRP